MLTALLKDHATAVTHGADKIHYEVKTYKSIDSAASYGNWVANENFLHQPVEQKIDDDAKLNCGEVPKTQPFDTPSDVMLLANIQP